METHVSYPILGYFRSQHINQNWLAALTTIVDASAYALAYGPDGSTEAAELTFRIGRHALGEHAHTFSTARYPEPRSRERLSREEHGCPGPRCAITGSSRSTRLSRAERNCYSIRTRTVLNVGSEAPCSRAPSAVSSRR
jgi:hypothetical protein